MKKKLLYIPLLALAFACNSPSEKNQSTTDKDIIALSKQQFDEGKMEIGSPSKRTFSGSIRVRGNVVAAPNAYVRISFPLEGIVGQLSKNKGQRVQKGDILYTIEGAEIIMLQQEFAEAFSDQKVKKLSYLRLKGLSADKIAAEKDLQQAESDYERSKAKYEALRAKLNLIHIAPEGVEKGNIVSKVTVKSPINGYVAEQYAVAGQMVQPQTTLAEIVNPQLLELNLQVFERDILRLKEGTPLSFYSPSNPQIEYKGTLLTVGRSINAETKAASCIARILPNQPVNVINGMSVEATIPTQLRDVVTLPQTAIVSINGSSYILEYLGLENQEYRFKKRQVDVGSIEKDFVEVLSPLPAQVLLKGSYNLITD